MKRKTPMTEVRPKKDDKPKKEVKPKSRNAMSAYRGKKL